MFTQDDQDPKWAMGQNQSSFLQDEMKRNFPLEQLSKDKLLVELKPAAKATFSMIYLGARLIVPKITKATLISMSIEAAHSMTPAVLYDDFGKSYTFRELSNLAEQSLVHVIQVLLRQEPEETAASFCEIEIGFNEGQEKKLYLALKTGKEDAKFDFLQQIFYNHLDLGENVWLRESDRNDIFRVFLATHEPLVNQLIHHFYEMMIAMYTTYADILQFTGQDHESLIQHLLAMEA